MTTVEAAEQASACGKSPSCPRQPAALLTAICTPRRTPGAVLAFECRTTRRRGREIIRTGVLTLLPGIRWRKTLCCVKVRKNFTDRWRDWLRRASRAHLSPICRRGPGGSPIRWPTHFEPFAVALATRFAIVICVSSAYRPRWLLGGSAKPVRVRFTASAARPSDTKI